MITNTLYPETQPYAEQMLAVSDLHSIHVEECGNPQGKPVIMIHGGPGGGINPAMRRLHDPELYRIILFDQRGCGKSTPYAELRENTTWDLVADMERIRNHFGIDKWQVFGGSWGSTLALAYAQTHPAHVSELILRGIFMIRRFEIEWFYSNGASIIYPDRFEAYQEHIPEAERGDMIAAYYKRQIVGTLGRFRAFPPAGSGAGRGFCRRSFRHRVCTHRMPLFPEQGLLRNG